MNQADIQQRAPKKITIDYGKGKVYQIVNNVNDKVYIGSTTQTLAQRLAKHKGDMNKNITNPFYKDMNAIGKEHFRIILIENFPCKDKYELEAREYAILNTYDKEKTYNSKFDGKHSDETKNKMSKSAFSLGRVGVKSDVFNRGCITFDKSRPRYNFRWYENKTPKQKQFSLAKYPSLQMAYLAACDYRNQIYPLSNEDYLQELPFTDSD